DRAALQRELRVAAEWNDGREVEPSREPGLDLMDAAVLDPERVLAQEHAQVIVDGFGDETLGAGVPRGAGKARGEPRRGHGEHERGGERRRRGVAPPRPPQHGWSARRARASRDFTVPTAHPTIPATSDSVSPSRSSRMTVRASSDSVISAASISSATIFLNRSSSMSSRSQWSSATPCAAGSTVSSPPLTGLFRSRRYALRNVLRRILNSH